MRLMAAGAALAALTSALVLAGCTRKAPEARDIDAREAMGMLRNGFAVLLDARPAQAVAGGMAEGARAVAPEQLAQDSPAWQQLASSAPDATFIVYAGSVAEARALAGKLTASGRRAAVLVAPQVPGCSSGMDGTLEAWRCAGFPVRR
jgi:rhodanese-related sulfurtransferase